MSSKELMPVDFEVREISHGDNDNMAKVVVAFHSNRDKEYTYYRKKAFDTTGFYFTIISGCKVIFDSNYKLIEVVRVYNTKGNYRANTSNIIGKGGSKTRKKNKPCEDAREVSKDIVKAVEEIRKGIDEALTSDEDEWEEVGGDKKPIWEVIEEPEIVEEENKLPELPKKVKHEKYEQIKTCMECGIPVYLAGPAGSGKNHTAEQIAKELGWNFYFSNSIQQEYKLTGFIDAGGEYHETEFYKACTDGDDCIFFLDEMDASIPDVLVLLNAAIANGYFEFPNGRVDFDNVHFIAAGNTVGSGADDMYTGRMVLDQATLDRFAIIEFDYDFNIERKLTKDNIELINFVHELRDIADKNGIRATFSLRCLMMVTKLEKSGMDIDTIIKIAVMKGLDKDTVSTFITDYTETSRYHIGLRNLQASF